MRVVMPVALPEVLGLRKQTGADRFDEYRAWGARHVWRVDPESRRLYVCDDVGLREIASLALPEFGLAVTADVAFD